MFELLICVTTFFFSFDVLAIVLPIVVKKNNKAKIFRRPTFACHSHARFPPFRCRFAVLPS